MSRRVRTLNLVFGAIGIGILVCVVGRTGVATLLANARLLGFGFVILILLAGARHVLRTIAWQRSFGAQTHAPGFLDLFRLRLIGEAFNDLAPAGPLVGESMKVWAGSKRMPFDVSASSVIIEDLIYALAVCLFVLSGGAFALIESAPLHQLRYGVAILGMGLIALVWLIHYIIKRDSASLGSVLAYARKWGWCRRFLSLYEPRLLAVEETIRSFFLARRSAFFDILGIEFITNFIGVLDAYVIVKATTGHGSMAAAYMIEAATRALQLGLVFLPGSLGVMEGAAGAVLRALGYTASEGVSLVIFRRVRAAFWAVVGLLLTPRYAAEMCAERESAT
jgi:uncharacterized protein (TIRG00374 family)